MAIINSITNAPGCSIQFLVDHYVSKKSGVRISRVTIYKILKRFKTAGAIKVEYDSLDRRKVRLYVKKDSPAITVHKQLEAFEMKLFETLEKERSELSKAESKRERDEIFNLISDAVNLSTSTLQLYLYRLLRQYPRLVPDGSVLEDLRSFFISKITAIYERLSKYYKSLHIIDERYPEMLRGNEANYLLATALSTESKLRASSLRAQQSSDVESFIAQAKLVQSLDIFYEPNQ